MKNWVQVFCGGMVGALLRFLIQSLVGSLIMLWVVNIVGSLILGSLNGYYERKQSDQFKLFFTTGMLGAFTTFSTFTEQWFYQLQQNVLMGLIYGISMTMICFLSAMVGYLLFRGAHLWNG